jgi:hypothetical protein
LFLDQADEGEAHQQAEARQREGGERQVDRVGADAGVIHQGYRLRDAPDEADEDQRAEECPDHPTGRTVPRRRRPKVAQREQQRHGDEAVANGEAGGFACRLDPWRRF